MLDLLHQLANLVGHSRIGLVAYLAVPVMHAPLSLPGPWLVALGIYGSTAFESVAGLCKDPPVLCCLFTYQKLGSSKPAG